MSENQLPPVVAAIQKLHIEGNVTPHSWYQHIKTESGLTDLVAITILADIVYWYRPTEELDEATHKSKGWRKKFSSDKLQRSYEAYEEMFGLTKRQAKDACLRLERLGLINRELRSFQDKQGRMLGNVLFLEPVPEAIEAITYPDNRLTEKRRTASKRRPSDGKTSDPLTEKRQTNTETTNRDYTENMAQSRPSVSFKERLSLIEQGKALLTSTGRKETAPGVLTELILSLYGQEVEISRVAKFVQEVGMWPLYELVTTHAGDKFNGSVLNWLWKCQETKKNKVIPGPGHASYQAQTVNTGFIRTDQSHSSMPDYVQRKHRVGKYEHWTDEQMAALEASEKQVAAIS